MTPFTSPNLPAVEIVSFSQRAQTPLFAHNNISNNQSSSSEGDESAALAAVNYTQPPPQHNEHQQQQQSSPDLSFFQSHFEVTPELEPTPSIFNGSESGIIVAPPRFSNASPDDRLSKEAAAAVYEVAKEYETGTNGRARSIPHALQCYLAAAQQGHSTAQLIVATIYRLGEDSVWRVPVNVETSFEYTRMAARGGSAEAQYQLGYMYTAGFGVAVSIPDAARWYERAALQQHVLAMEQLYSLYVRGGPGLARDPHRALTWISLAARQGSPTALYRCGFLQHTGGFTGTRNARLALRFYRAAISQDPQLTLPPGIEEEAAAEEAAEAAERSMDALSPEKNSSSPSAMPGTSREHDDSADTRATPNKEPHHHELSEDQEGGKSLGVAGTQEFAGTESPPSPSRESSVSAVTFDESPAKLGLGLLLRRESSSSSSSSTPLRKLPFASGLNPPDHLLQQFSGHLVISAPPTESLTSTTTTSSPVSSSSTAPLRIRKSATAKTKTKRRRQRHRGVSKTPWKDHLVSALSTSICASLSAYVVTMMVVRGNRP